MKPESAIACLREIEAHLADLKVTHPHAVIKAGKLKGRFHITVYGGGPGKSIEEIASNVRQVLEQLCALKLKHPHAWVCPEIHKKQFGFTAIPGSTITAGVRDRGVVRFNETRA